MQKINIIDNFLPEELHLQIKNFLYGQEVPWFFRHTDVTPITNNKNGFFSFCYYNHNRPDHLKYFEHIVPIWKLLNIDDVGITQVRANLNFRDKDCIESGFHTDKEGGKTSILYLTTCNGKTVFKDNDNEIAVDNIDNRSN